MTVNVNFSLTLVRDTDNSYPGPVSAELTTLKGKEVLRLFLEPGARIISIAIDDIERILAMRELLESKE